MWIRPNKYDDDSDYVGTEEEEIGDRTVGIGFMMVDGGSFSGRRHGSYLHHDTPCLEAHHILLLCR
jgi:hypothetical protein